MVKIKQTSGGAFWRATLIALAMGLLWPAMGLAQYQINNNAGRLLEANNRIGSGGSNGAVQYGNSSNADTGMYLANQTGYGNYSLPYAGRNQYIYNGNAPLNPDSLFSKLPGVITPYSSPTYGVPQNYLYLPSGSTAATIAPAGFSQVVGGVYQPAAGETRAAADYRLGDVLGVTPMSSAIPPPGETTGPGPVDMSANMTPDFLNNSPVYGARPFALQPGGQNYAMVNGVITQTLAPRLSAEQIVQLRSELSQSSTPWNISTAVPGAATQPSEEISPSSAYAGTGPIQAGITGTTPLGATSLSQQASLSGVGPVTPGLSTGQSTRHYLSPLPPPSPSEQSTQYIRLRQLLQQYQAAHPRSDEEANRLFQQAVKARREYEQSLGGGVSAPAPAAPQAIPVQPTGGAAPPTPLEIGSIGQGIRASGLSDLVQQGEDLARHQRFKDAIGKFLDARQVAPNNMLISVDLANAELGAGFYNQAEGFLREAFTNDPATLMARYDVKSIIGDDRLQAVIADLKQIAASGDDATPVFLLAYLSYGGGETDKALQYLKLAQSRAGGQDDVIRALGDHWALPPTTKPSSK